MSQSTLFRIAAAGLIAGAVITALASLVSPQNSDSITAAVASPFFYPSGLGVTLGGIAIVLCVPAVYIRQHASSGVLGLIGAILIVAGGMALTVFVNLFDVIAMPWVIGLHLTSSQLQGGPPAFNIFWPVASIAVTLGGVLLGDRHHPRPRAGAGDRSRADRRRAGQLRSELPSGYRHRGCPGRGQLHGRPGLVRRRPVAERSLARVRRRHHRPRGRVGREAPAPDGPGGDAAGPYPCSAGPGGAPTGVTVGAFYHVPRLGG